MEKSDDRNLGVIVSTVLLSVFVAAMAVCAALSFIWRLWPAGALCVAAFCAALWLLAGLTKLWKKKDAFDRNFRARNFDEAEKYAFEIAGSKLFYPIMRFTGFCVMLAISMAKDDLQEAEKYIFRIRHGGGAGWKYRMAYYYTLILIDKGTYPPPARNTRIFAFIIKTWNFIRVSSKFWTRCSADCLPVTIRRCPPPLPTLPFPSYTAF